MACKHKKIHERYKKLLKYDFQKNTKIKKNQKFNFLIFLFFIKIIYNKNIVFPYKIKKLIKMFKVQKSKNVNFVNLQNLKKFIF